MRVLGEQGDPNALFPEVFPVLQFCAINEPLFPNLERLYLWAAVGGFVPFIPSFLSPTTTVIDIEFKEQHYPHKAAFASLITTFPTLCPNLQKIRLWHSVPRDPVIVAAVSQFLLTTNRDALRLFHVNSPLTEEARQAIHKLPDLCELWTVVEGSTSLPTMVLPNLTDMHITYDHDHDWLQGFCGATLGRLNSVSFLAISKPGDFLEEFQNVALTTSTQHTLSAFSFYASHSWNPNYLSLLVFKQLTELDIEFSCHDGCSSRLDDDVVISLAQAMPKLKILRLGGTPCRIPTGVTFKGLITLACNCPQLSELRIHFRADSLVEATAGGEPLSPSERSAALLQAGCALTDLYVGEIPIPGGSALAVALTLLRVFSRILDIHHVNPEWEAVEDEIERLKQTGVHVRQTGQTRLLPPVILMSDALKLTLPTIRLSGWGLRAFPENPRLRIPHGYRTGARFQERSPFPLHDTVKYFSTPTFHHFC
jgi:hypothetical protein